MPITNPSLISGFDTNQTNTSEPSVTLKSDGYPFGAIPTSANFNHMLNQLFNNLNHIKRDGTYLWDAGVSYNQYSIVMRSGKVYQSTTNSNSGNDPLTDFTNWRNVYGHDTLTIDFSSDADITLDTLQNIYPRYNITDTGVVLTTSRNVIVDDIQRFFYAKNSTAQDLVFKTSAGTGITVLPNSELKLYCDGTDVIITEIGTPISSIITVALGTAPEGFLECDGSAISRTTYSNLFSSIGTIYGVGDGSTTFNIPDLRGEFIRGWDNGRGIDSGRGIGSYQADEFKSHSHGYGAYTVNISAGSGYGTTHATADGVQTTSKGGVETRPRNIAMMYCIKY